MKNLREERRPADLWFWSDWIKSFDVRTCSLAAQGLWVNMLSIMNQASRKGVLDINGVLLDNKTLAKWVGVSEEEAVCLLKELEDHRVFSKLADGAIINRRMYREGEIRRKRSEAGRMGMESRYQKPNKPPNKPITPLEDDNDNEDKNKNKELDNISSYFNKWNAFAELHGLSKITDIEKKSSREVHLRARMNRKGFSFDSLLETIGKSPFLLGQIDSKPGSARFFATFDWIIDKTNYQKIMEGNYLERKPAPKEDRFIKYMREQDKMKEKKAKEEL